MKKPPSSQKPLSRLRTEISLLLEEAFDAWHAKTLENEAQERIIAVWQVANKYDAGLLAPVIDGLFAALSPGATKKSEMMDICRLLLKRAGRQNITRFDKTQSDFGVMPTTSFQVGCVAAQSMAIMVRGFATLDNMSLPSNADLDPTREANIKRAV